MQIMSKDWFVKEMGDFLEEKKKNDEFSDKIYDLLGASAADVIGSHDFEVLALNIIGDAINANDWLMYFVYECECDFTKFSKNVSIDDIREILFRDKITTLEELYDFIISLREVV